MTESVPPAADMSPCRLGVRVLRYDPSTRDSAARLQVFDLAATDSMTAFLVLEQTRDPVEP